MPEHWNMVIRTNEAILLHFLVRFIQYFLLYVLMYTFSKKHITLSGIKFQAICYQKLKNKWKNTKVGYFLSVFLYKGRL